MAHSACLQGCVQSVYPAVVHSLTSNIVLCSQDTVKQASRTEDLEEGEIVDGSSAVDNR